MKKKENKREYTTCDCCDSKVLKVKCYRIVIYDNGKKISHSYICKDCAIINGY